jgi:rSAM/selenodomain-associated transferase 2
MGISVIIPALNEAACIADTIRSLRAQQAGQIIVVDGGSHDGTARLAGEADLVLSSSPGRATQMNAGAARASRDCLLFLHADCSLENGWTLALERCLARGNVSAGCFSIRVCAEGFLYRCIDWCASARVRLSGLIYGDQGLFLRRQHFNRLGGFPPLRFMEDLFFSKTLRRHGRVEVIRSRIFVSPRRWQKTGILQQSLRNWTLTALAAAGMQPDRLAGYYPPR